jgi:hypothetical protein
MVSFHFGEFVAARALFEEALRLCDPVRRALPAALVPADSLSQKKAINSPSGEQPSASANRHQPNFFTTATNSSLTTEVAG